MKYTKYFVFAVLVILVRPSNSQSPSTLRYHIKEQEKIGLLLGTIPLESSFLTELSADELSKLEFSLLKQGDEHASLFNIGAQTGELRIAKIIDREVLCEFEQVCILKFEVVVYNYKSDVRTIPIEVTIDDINDNSPVFPKNLISLSVPESVNPGFTLLTSAAIDYDTGVNNTVKSYKIEPDEGYFGLKEKLNFDGTSDLGIIINFPLDRESKPNFQFRIIATDGGDPPLSGSVLVNINVSDINDNRPVFSNSTYNVSIPENLRANTTILQLKAKDLDIGSNKEISYLFSARVSRKVRELFSINEHTGDVVVINNVDYEQANNHQFLVLAVDHGNPPQTSQAVVSIYVHDLNDNSPVISINLPPGGARILESARLDSFVAYVLVSDEDSGMNGRVACQVFNDHFALKLDSSNTNKYRVVVNKHLDHDVESLRDHNVTIACSDNGSPQLESRSSFLVHVDDVNDNVPVFPKSSYLVYFEEEQPKGGIVMNISAFDLDSGINGQVTYSLVGESSLYSLLSIDQNTGRISTLTSIDREKLPVIKFKVKATDGGGNFTTVPVTVMIKDINDNKPVFDKPRFEFYVLENQPAGTRAGNITVSDADIGMNAKILYRFTASTPSTRKFSLDMETGVLRTRVRLNREVQSRFDFSVVVMDNGRPAYSATVNVTVFVLDDNDNAPNITYPNKTHFQVNVAYGSAPGYLISKIKAYDEDESSPSALFYFIQSGDGRRLFKMDSKNGYISIARQMQPYDIKKHKLVVAVRDNGTPKRTSYANLNIAITGGNNTNMVTTNEDGDTKNITIVIILIVVTFAVSIAIIITICVIRKIDKDREGPELGQHSKMPSEAFIHESQLAMVPRGTQDMDVSEEPKKRKEVSFSLDEENNSIHNSSFLIGNSFSTFKKDPLSMADPRQEEFQQRLAVANMKPEDATSDTSGETGTSDSGRGGSEEDINSNRGPYSPSDTEDLPSVNSVDFNRKNKHIFDDGYQVLQHGHDLTVGNKYLPVPRSYVQNYNNHSKNINNDLQRVPLRSSLYYPNKMYDNTDYTRRSLRHVTFKDSETPPQSRKIFTLSDWSPDSGLGINKHQRLAHYLNTSCGADSLHSFTASRDDDDNTTTSGSYTLDQDDIGVMLPCLPEDINV